MLHIMAIQQLIPPPGLLEKLWVSMSYLQSLYAFL